MSTSRESNLSQFSAIVAEIAPAFDSSLTEVEDVDNTVQLLAGDSRVGRIVDLLTRPYTSSFIHDDTRTLLVSRALEGEDCWYPGMNPALFEQALDILVATRREERII